MPKRKYKKGDVIVFCKYVEEYYTYVGDREEYKNLLDKAGVILEIKDDGYAFPYVVKFNGDTVASRVFAKDELKLATKEESDKYFLERYKYV